MTDFYGPYVVTAYKANQQAEELYVFGPFNTEKEAQAFFVKVQSHPGWEPEEVPVLNKPEVFDTGNERL